LRSASPITRGPQDEATESASASENEESSPSSTGRPSARSSATSGLARARKSAPRTVSRIRRPSGSTRRSPTVSWSVWIRLLTADCVSRSLERVAVPATIHCDHLIEARATGSSDLLASRAENGEIYDFLRRAAAKYGLGFWGPGAGIIHQVVLETYAFPGAMILGTDSHTPNAGGLGACAVGVGGADAVEVLAGLPWELRYPRRIAVVLTGELDGWTSPKDVILHVAGVLGVAGGTHAIVEYIGPGARTISATGKATITNMGAELGATTSIFSADARMLTYLRATDRAALAEVVADALDLLAPDPAVEANPDSYYDRVIRLDLSTLEPHINGPHSPDRAQKISAMKRADVGAPDAISTALIGSCTNSSYQDMSRAADVAAQALAHGLRAVVPLLVSPGSERVRATIARDGQLELLEKIGATVLASACGPCIGQWRRTDGGAPNTIVTSFNRNFPGRNDGSTATRNMIASPEIVTALALAGRLSFDPRVDTLIGADGIPFVLTPPARAPEVPAQSFVRADAYYQAPGLSSDPLTLDPASERLQALSPWPAWDGRDLVEAPILMKTSGKTTTDHISPAGPWLKYRGHLDKFSDNFLSGATNAFTGEVGVGISALARRYQAAGVRWIVVGDHNYGEGSSREHAALSPRWLGGAAVIARSFARIHESNLKKQGLLALTFVDPRDYDRLGARDRVSLIGLSGMSPGAPIAGVIHHADGTRAPLALAHSYTASQIAWFRAGSALNLC